MPLPGQDDGLATRVDAADRWRAMQLPRGKRWRFLIFGERPEPVPSFRGLVEDPKPDKLGICCSGGGIRSAAFNLGALQALQKKEELEKASYLAAVSGGSYIAAAFSMVAKSWPTGEARPAPGEDHADDSDPALIDSGAPFAPGSPEEQYLRNRSSYMAPDGSAMLYLGYRILLGLVFNLLFLSLLLIALALVSGELYRGWIGHCDQQGCHIDLDWWWTAPVGALALSAVLGLLGMVRRTADRPARFLQTWSTRLLIVAAALAFLVLAVPLLVQALHGGATEKSSGYPKPGAGGVGGAGLAALLAGVAGVLRQALATPKKTLEELTKTQKRLRDLSARTRRTIAYAAGAVIGPALLVSVFLFTVSISMTDSSWVSRHWWAIAAAAAAAFAALYFATDLTSWSLHPFYRRRLSTAFALKRIGSRDMTRAERDRAEAIAPSDPSAPDTPVAIERDYGNLVKLSETEVTGRPWPTLLVCAAANVSDPGATPPGRHVTSFTFSHKTIGGPLVGAAPTTEFEQTFEAPDAADLPAWRVTLMKIGAFLRRYTPLPNRRRRRNSDFTLPAAVAMSGAAISPSMGKMTPRPLTFLLALANIRLGVWVPNPRWVTGPENLRLQLFGRPRPSYLLRELLGRNRVGGRYLYVTDGGHYENLGLVELLRRGCRKIYCFDASGGEGFEALGDAVALARSELGISIEIAPDKLFPDQETDEAKASVVGVKFAYPGDAPDTPPATLVYARNVMTGASPWDVKAYHRIDPSFPHNSTADQLYTDQKFEGYRVLGERAGQRAFDLMRTPL